MEVALLQNEVKLASKSVELDVLAFDEWGGLATMPEMIAAFVTPNHPEVIKITSEAAVILAKWVTNPAYDGYQVQDPNFTHQQVAAVYYALQNRRLTYSSLPPSYEENGQRIRLPDTLLSQHLGNCIDITALFAACLEAIGVHPLIVFIAGHAFVGAWLVAETFPESAEDDVSLLKKRMAEGVHELCLVESTALAEHAHSSFEDAERAAAHHLDDETRFHCVVDVKRTRRGGIRPLPLRVKTETGWTFAFDADAQDQQSVHAPDAFTVYGGSSKTENLTPPKLTEWKRRLLDLSSRNTLLNFRATKSTIPLLSANLGDVEDNLAEHVDLQLLPIPGEWDESIPEAMHRLLREELAQRCLRTPLVEADLKARGVQLSRAARASLEENGANTLYLALGFLKWYETDVSEKVRKAPLVLIPIDLIRKNSRVGFVIRMRDEEPQINITLLEMLRQDFGLEIRGLDPLPRDDHGVDLLAVFAQVRQMIKHQSRWDVDENAYLGLFSFGQFVMWNDLHHHTEKLMKNPVVASLMAGRLQWQPSDIWEREASPDDRYLPHELLVPISADSSQLQAIAAADAGESFVLHGPPGTGKSQTITNMIANALAQGKTVLFVAEKMAALTVVQRRLEDLGLGSFCLELHSNKSNKKAVLKQLRMALETPKSANPEDWRQEAGRLATVRSVLNRHQKAMHQSHASGLSVNEAITQFEAVRSAPDVVHFDAAKAAALTTETLRTWLELAESLRVAGEACGGPHQHPLEGIRRSDYSVTIKSQASTLLLDFQEKNRALQAAWEVAIRIVPYHASVLPPVRATAEQFHDRLYTQKIAEQLAHVVKLESPISRNLLYRRVLNAWGIKRLGPRIDVRFDAIVPHLSCRQTTQNGTVFYWHPSQAPNSLDYFRVASDEKERRDAEDLPVEEVAAAVRYVLETQISLPKPQLIRELAKVFGYQRTGSMLEQVLGLGVEYAIRREFVKWDDHTERVVGK